MGNITFSDVCAVAAFLGAILAIIINLRNIKSSNKDEGKKDGQIMTELGYIKSGIDDIKRKQEKQDDFNMQVNTRLTQVEQSAKQAHKRIDTLENHYHPD